MIKKIKLDNNRPTTALPIKKRSPKKIEFSLSDDYLSIKHEILPKNLFIGPKTTTIDHKISINKPHHLSEVSGKDTTSGVPYFYIRPTYNYLALDWEAKFNKLSELQSPMAYTEEEGV